MFNVKHLWAIVPILTASTCMAKAGSAAIPLFKADSIAARSGALVINDAAADQLRQSTDTVSLGSVPLVNGGTSDFNLTPMPVMAKNATITLMRDGGATQSLPLPDIKTWYGSDPADPDRALFAAADVSGNVRIMVTGNEHTSVTVIAPAVAGDPASYRIAPTRLPAIPFCENQRFAPASAYTGTPVAGQETRNNTIYEIELMVDVGNKLFVKEQNDPALTLDHLIDVFGAVNAIYQRDLKARLAVVSLTIWDTPDPVSVDSNGDSVVQTDDQLDNYQSYVLSHRAGVHRDLAHFLDYNRNLGGLAYVDVLGSGAGDYRFGVSNVYADGDFPADVNTYYWDTMVVAHEIGHNVGSVHTQCYSPPIDCCAIGDACSQCTTAAPAAGTLMSYCHLQFQNGGTMLMQFHQRCIDVMRPKIESSSLLSAFTNQPDMVVEGVDGIFCPSSSDEAGRGSLLKATSVGALPIDTVFSIENHGTTNLVLTGVPTVSISGDPLVSVIAQPSATTVTPNGPPATFTVRFLPLTAGRHTATIQISGNDPDTPSYSFQVSGTFVQPAPAQSFTYSGNTSIPDGGDYYMEIPIEVSGVTGGTISDIKVSFNGTNCAMDSQTGIEHPDVGDLAMELISPTGTRVRLMNSPGAGYEGAAGANFCHTMLDDDAPASIESITDAAAPYTGTYKPDQPLSMFNGEQPDGTWDFLVYDFAGGGTGGVIHSISLVISGQVEADVKDWSVYK